MRQVGSVVGAEAFSFQNIGNESVAVSTTSSRGSNPYLYEIVDDFCYVDSHLHAAYALLLASGPQRVLLSVEAFVARPLGISVSGGTSAAGRTRTNLNSVGDLRAETFQRPVIGTAQAHDRA